MSRETDWDLAATLYADSSVPVREIARRCGVSASTIGKRARREGWPPRKPRQDGSEPNFHLLLARIFRTLDRQMRDIERRVEGTNPEQRGAAERERDARTLASLTRTLEKLRDLEREAAQAARTAGPAAADDGAETPDTEDMRAALESRLDRLLAAAGEESLSEKSE